MFIVIHLKYEDLRREPLYWDTETLLLLSYYYFVTKTNSLLVTAFEVSLLTINFFNVSWEINKILFQAEGWRLRGHEGKFGM